MQSQAPAIAALTVLSVFLMMGGEALLSSANERGLRRRGAVEPPGDVYRRMRWAYPACFLAMAIEGAWRGPSSQAVLLAGLAIFGAAKALKAWAMMTLGPRWTFRILVPPGAPLVRTGPYSVLRHPNYLAVVGELVGMAATVCAPVTGVAAVVGFGWLIRARIQVEDRALGRE